MNAPTILVVPPTAAANSADPAASMAENELGFDAARSLEDAGVIVVVHPEPDRVRLLQPEPPVITGSTLLGCALRALASGGPGSLAPAQRERFTLEVAKAFEEGSKA